MVNDNLRCNMEFLKNASARPSGSKVWEQIKNQRRSRPAQPKIRNRLEMTCMLLDVSGREKGFKIKVAVGGLANDENATPDASGIRSRRFAVEVSKKTKLHMPAEYDPQAKLDQFDMEKLKETNPNLIAYNTIHRLNEHSTYSPKIEADPCACVGSLLHVSSITFSHFHYDKFAKMLYLEKVDRASLVQGFEPDLLSEAMLRLSNKPFGWMISEGVEKTKKGTANFTEEYAIKVGSTLHPILHCCEYDERMDEEQQGTRIDFKFVGMEVKYVDDIFSNKLQCTVPGRCFRTVVELCQWSGAPLAQTTPRQRRLATVHLNIYDTSLALFRIQDLDGWCHIGPTIMRHFNYTLLTLENMEGSARYPGNFAEEADLPQDESMSLDLDVKCTGILCNMPREIRRVGLRVPDKAMLLLLCLTKEKPFFDDEAITKLDAANYHTTMNDAVVNLMESTRNVTELINGGKYEFFAVTSATLTNQDYELLNSDAMPQDSLYMLLIPEFVALCTRVARHKLPRDKAELEKMFGMKCADPTHMRLVDFTTKIGEDIKFVVFAVAKAEMLATYVTEESLNVASKYVSCSKAELREALLEELRDRTPKQSAPATSDAPQTDDAAAAEPSETVSADKDVPMDVVVDEEDNVAESDEAEEEEKIPKTLKRKATGGRAASAKRRRRKL